MAIEAKRVCETGDKAEKYVREHDSDYDSLSFVAISEGGKKRLDNLAEKNGIVVLNNGRQLPRATKPTLLENASILIDKAISKITS